MMSLRHTANPPEFHCLVHGDGRQVENMLLHQVSAAVPLLCPHHPISAFVAPLPSYLQYPVRMEVLCIRDKETKV